MFERASIDAESRDATKITSALADSRIYSFMKMMTLNMCIVAFTIFLSVSLSFSSSVVPMSTSRPAGVCRSNRWTKFYSTSWAHWKLLFWVSGFLQTQCWSGIWRGSDEAWRFIEAPDHTGFNPDTLRLCKWYQRRLPRVTFHTSHLSVGQVTILLKQTGRQKQSLLKMMKKESRWR